MKQSTSPVFLGPVFLGPAFLGIFLGLSLTFAGSARAQDPDVAAPAAARPPSQVHLDLQSDRDNTTLLKMTRAGGMVAASSYGTVVGAFESYEPVCTAPCEIDADPNAIYRVAGRGVTPSDTFSLPRGSSKLGLRVHAGSASARGWGMASAGLGLAGAVTGGTFLLLGSILGSASSDTSSTTYRQDQDRASTFRTIGWVSLGAGAAFLALGIGLMVSNHTDVESDKGQELAKIPLPGKLQLGPTGVVF